METVEIPNKKRKVVQIFSNGNDRDFKQKAKLHSRDKKSTISLRKQFIAYVVVSHLLTCTLTQSRTVFHWYWDVYVRT